MKINIRRGLFETNSSSEHSITIMNNDMFKEWKDGKVLARVKTINEDNHCWGNFWSILYTLEFTDNIKKAREENEVRFKKYIEDDLKRLDEWKEQCLNHKPTGDDYEDNHLYKFDEGYYNTMKKKYNSYTYEKDCSKVFGLTDGHMWMTYEEYWNDFIVNGDCYSPFQHEDKENNVYIIGKYYHS